MVILAEETARVTVIVPLWELGSPALLHDKPYFFSESCIRLMKSPPRTVPQMATQPPS